MLTYIVEWTNLDTGDEIHSEHFFNGLEQARRRARYLSRNSDIGLVYVVACDDREGGRTGAEAYANGRRDHVEGRIAA